jgi:hypothetical protein
MCDVIEMPDGTEIQNFEGEDDCLCVHTQEEILTYAIQKLPKIEYNQKLIIERSCFGWNFKIESV